VIFMINETGAGGSHRGDYAPAEEGDPLEFGHWAERYFAAKSSHDLDTLIGCFASGISYEDAVLARNTQGAERLRATYAALFAAATGASASTLLWAWGGQGGGAAGFHNDAGLFGAPMDLIAVIELGRGRVIRQRDYWDGRSLPASTLAGMRERYPAMLATVALPVSQRSRPPAALAALAAAYRTSLTRGSGLSALLTEDAVLRDLATGVRLSGGEAVAEYLRRNSSELPYGAGARETNVVGGPAGGAWEWAAGEAWAHTVGAGVTAVRLGRSGRIAELAVAWDTSRLDERSSTALPGKEARR
jgi:hypothetical protein